MTQGSASGATPIYKNASGTSFYEAFGQLRGTWRIAAEIPLLAAWSAIGVGAALDDGAYTPLAVILVTSATVLLLLVTAARLMPAHHLSWPVRGMFAVAAEVALLVAYKYPAGIYGSGAWLTTSRALTAATATLAVLWLILPLRQPRAAAAMAVLLMGAAGVAMILSSPRPYIDDWYMLQAAAHALSHGQNIYTARWSGPPGEASNLFVYLPGSGVLVWPFHAAFGDVRYGILAALMATSYILISVSGNATAALVGCLVVLYPKAIFGLEQSWIDPLVLLAVCGAAYAVVRGRKGWAVVAFAVALTCKQTAWILVPLAFAWKEFGWRRTLMSVAAAVLFMLPWAVTDPHAFYFGVISWLLHYPPRLDSLSVFATAFKHGLHPGVGLTALATLVALGLAMWRAPRDAYGFLLGSAFVMAVFNLANKQAFFNEWQLAAGLALAAVTFGTARNEPQAHAREDREEIITSGPA